MNVRACDGASFLLICRAAVVETITSEVSKVYGLALHCPPACDGHLTVPNTGLTNISVYAVNIYFALYIPLTS